MLKPDSDLVETGSKPEPNEATGFFDKKWEKNAVKKALPLYKNRFSNPRKDGKLQEWSPSIQRALQDMKVFFYFFTFLLTILACLGPDLDSE
jgi:hypothetical protein